MQQNKLLRWVQIWKLTMLFLLVSNFVPFLDVLAQGQVVNVKVLIERTAWNGCYDDAFNNPDIYFDVSIDGVWLSFESNPITSQISPFNVNRELSRDVDVSKRNIPIIIEEWDDDGVTKDDQCDVQPGPGEALNLMLDLATCQISGEATGVCGTSIEFINNDGVYLTFRIDVEEPTHASGLSVRCLHDPIWPQPGDQVTITAEALDGNAILKGGVINDIEIWVDNTNTAVANTASTSGSFGTNTFTFNYTPTGGADEILYRCRVSDDGDEVSSGWHIAHIGTPPSSWIRSVPILYTGPMGSRQDIVFIADKDDYTGPDDPQFLTDVHSVIRNAYYAAGLGGSGRPFLFNQNLINFWIALGEGNAAGYGSGDHHELPDGWDDHYHFADAGAIVHVNNLRDFAMRGERIFSAEPTSPGTFLHETGHEPFGLADEYCCDSHYFQPDPHPNIYEDQGECLDDALSTGVADACLQIYNPTTGDTIDWFRLDSDSTFGDDLMRGSGNLTPRPADERRIDWLFEICRNGGC